MRNWTGNTLLDEEEVFNDMVERAVRWLSPKGKLALAVALFGDAWTDSEGQLVIHTGLRAGDEDGDVEEI
jgi:hypothetical protein|tara:strand:+ start:1422 stop:1631 length:210 start_codon:yes stop_codon:yes gene_type:complete